MANEKTDQILDSVLGKLDSMTKEEKMEYRRITAIGNVVFALVKYYNYSMEDAYNIVLNSSLIDALNFDAEMALETTYIDWAEIVHQRFLESHTEREYTLKQIASMCGLSYEDAVSEVCDCDLLYGKTCDFHKQPNMKCSLSQWQRMSTDGDQYGISKITKFIPLEEEVLKGRNVLALARFGKRKKF